MSSTDAYLDNSPSDPKASTISETVNDYLSALRPKVPKSTYESHSTSLKTLTRDINTTRPFASLTPDEIGRLLIKHNQAGTLDTQTVTCAISTISNYLAYHQESHPERDKQQVLNGILTGDIDENLRDELNNTHCFDLTDSDYVAIDLFRDHLSKSAWGTLGHVVTEIIIDTWAQPGPILDLNRGDFDAARNVIWLELPKTFVVCKSGLHQSWEAPLSENTTRAIETFIEHGRDDRLLSQPLFASTQGKQPSITRKTLYNHIRRARNQSKRRIPSDHPRQDEIEESLNRITPCTIREYSISLEIP